VTPNPDVLAAQLLESIARTGSPTHARLPEWTPYDISYRPTIVFDRTCRLENDPRSGKRMSWEGIPNSRLGF
jgi:para-nitrobenzyl esterase